MPYLISASSHLTEAVLARLLTAVVLACQSKPSVTQPISIEKPVPVMPATLPVEDAPLSVADARVVNDFLVVPGDRVGPIQGNTSEADLLRLLGPSVVTVADTFYAGEGETFVGTVLYKGTVDEVQIFYSDPADRVHPSTVRIRPGFKDDEGNTIVHPAASRWTTTGGVRIGTTLRELERLNGKPFTLWGFAWDYGGLVSNWQGGKLTPPDKKASLSMALGPPVLMTAAQDKVYHDLMGDGEFTSSRPAMQRLNPIVGNLETTVD